MTGIGLYRTGYIFTFRYRDPERTFLHEIYVKEAKWLYTRVREGKFES